MQLEKVESKFPEQLLLQYTYYLNKDTSKQVLTGFDVDTFKPCIVMTDSCTKTVLHFSQDNWNFVLECIDNCAGFLNQERPNCWATTFDKVWNIFSVGDFIQNEERYIVIKNIAFDREIIFNADEFLLFYQFAPFLSHILKNYEDKQGYVKEYYRAYLIKCYVRDVVQLQNMHFFKTDGATINFFRLFSEIPIICKDKLKDDLRDLYAGQV